MPCYFPMGVRVCGMQDFANELLHAMLSWDGEDQKSPSYLRILELVRAHVSLPFPGTLFHTFNSSGLM